MQDISQILDYIMKLKGFTKVPELAKLFSVGDSTPSSWRNRGTIPYKKGDTIEELLEATRKILTSGNQFAIDALERNIRYFSYTIDLENRLNNLEQRFEVLERKKTSAENL